MRLRRRKPTVSYWVNGHGPFDTAEERDKMHAILREVADHNRRCLAIIEKESLAPSDHQRYNPDHQNHHLSQDGAEANQPTRPPAQGTH